MFFTVFVLSNKCFFEQVKHQLNLCACLYSAIKRKTVKESITIDTVLFRVIQKHQREMFRDHFNFTFCNSY